MPKTCYIADSSAETCETCTAATLFAMANDRRIIGEDMSRRLAALIRLAHYREAEGHHGSDEPFTFSMCAIQRTINARNLDTDGIEDEFSRLVDIDRYQYAETPRSGVYCDGCTMELEEPYMTCVLCERDGWLGQERDDLSDFVRIDGERHDFGSHVVASSDGDSGLSVLCGRCQAEPDESGVWSQLFELPVLVTLTAAWCEWMEANFVRLDEPRFLSFGFFLSELRRAAIALSHVGELFPIAA